MRIRENVFAFRRLREYEQFCSYWQSLSVKKMRQWMAAICSSRKRRCMMTKQESKNLNYEDYQDFLDAAEGFISELKNPIGDGNKTV